MCRRATAKFGRASSRPTQKLGVDLGIAIVLCEALSRGPPEMRKITYATWSVEMSEWLVKMLSLFRVVKPGISILLRGHRLFRAAGASVQSMAPPEGGWFAHSGPSKTGCRPGAIVGQWSAAILTLWHRRFSAKSLKSLALPREAREANKINGIRNRLGKKWLHCFARLFKTAAQADKRGRPAPGSFSASQFRRQIDPNLPTPASRTQ